MDITSVVAQRVDAWPSRLGTLHAPPLPSPRRSSRGLAARGVPPPADLPCGLSRQLPSSCLNGGGGAPAVAARHSNHPALVLPHASGILRPLAAWLLPISAGELLGSLQRRLIMTDVSTSAHDDMLLLEMARWLGCASLCVCIRTFSNNLAGDARIFYLVIMSASTCRSLGTQPAMTFSKWTGEHADCRCNAALWWYHH